MQYMCKKFSVLSFYFVDDEPGMSLSSGSDSCRGHFLGQSSASPGFGRCLLQDEDHSGSRPHSFPGLPSIRSGTSPEKFRSGPELTVS